MNVYVCFDGDKIGRQVGRAVRSNDVAEVRRVDQAINQGNEIWRSFALRAGGSVIEIGGDEGRIEVEIGHLPEVPEIARQYAEAVGATVSVGVGMVLSESADALAVAKIRGGNQILLWNPEMQVELDASIANAPTESQKIADEYLVKADQHLTGKNRGAHAGFSGHHGDGQPSKDKPKASQGDHDEAKVVEHEIEASKLGQPAPEQTHAAEDFESTLHSAAQDQEKQDGDDEVNSDGQIDQVKQRIIGVLGQIKAQMPMLQQIRAASPDVYQTIMNLVQGVILMGKQVMKNQPQEPVDDSEPQHVQAGLDKSEDDCQDCGSIAGVNIDCQTCDAYWKKRKLAKSVSQIHPGPEIRDMNRKTHDYSHVLPAGEAAKGMRLEVSHIPASDECGEHLSANLYHHKNLVGDVTGHITEPMDSGEVKSVEPHSSLDAPFHGRGLGQAMYEAVYAHAKNQLGAVEVRGGIHSEDAHKLHQRLAKKHGFVYSAPATGTLATKAGFPHGPYSYAIKAEQEPVIDDREICGSGKGISFHRKAATLDKGAMAPSHHHLKLPVGSTHNGEIKVQHADGKTGWIGVNSGMVSGQEPGAPNTGANTHPVSERKPSAK